MRQRRDKTDDNGQAAAGMSQPRPIPFGGLDKVAVDGFVVHGRKNPEGGVRRWREAEYTELAIKTLYPNGVPGNLSDNKLAEVVNMWLNQNTDWSELRRDEISRWTVRRMRKLSRG